MAQKTAWNAAALTEADINLYLMGEGGAWQSWTPTVTQSGSVTVTNTRSRFARYGRTIHYTLDLAVTGTGTAANAITVTLPVAAAAGSLTVVGSGRITDISVAANFTGLAINTSTTVMSLLPTTGTAGNYLGATNFTAALASGDTITISGTYEAAS